MAKVYFGKTVKYKGTKYLPNVTFEVAESDLDDLKKAGAWLVEEAVIDEPVVEEVKVEEPLREIDMLRLEADELGIEYKKNWGVNKLEDAIAEVKADVEQ